MQNVIISIQGEQFFSEIGGSGFVELVTDGQMDAQGGTTFLTYQEGVDESAPTQTMLVVDQTGVTLLRGGEAATQMVFEQGRRHISYYDTGEGATTVGIMARHVEAKLDEQGGRIQMVYDVEIDNALAGENSIVIDVRPASGTTAPKRGNGSVFHDRYIN